MIVWSGQSLALYAYCEISGVRADPDSLTYTVWHTAMGSAAYQWPNTASAITREATGTFYMNYQFVRPGVYHVHVRTTGVNAASATAIQVRAPF